MRPNERKQLPPRLYHLFLAELDEFENSITVFSGPDVFPSYTPIFDKNTGKLIGLFLSTQVGMVFSRVTNNAGNGKFKPWPSDKLFLDVAKILSRPMDFSFKALLELNEKSKQLKLIDPSRDPRPLWELSSLPPLLSCSNIDTWVGVVQTRLEHLKKGQAGVTDRIDMMGMLGIVLGAVACYSSADEILTSVKFDEIIGLEADAWLNMPFNHAYMFRTGSVGSISDYPFKSFLKDETTVVCVPVPEFLHFLLREKNVAPFYNGKTYIGLKAFKAIARKMFIQNWKIFTLSVYKKLHDIESDPALSEFMSRVRLRPFQAFNNATSLVSSTPEILFPVPDKSIVPPCLMKLFSGGVDLNLKHYGRWQLAELAVDMGWPKHSILSLVPVKSRSEIAAAYESYRRAGRTPNRCQIYMRSTDLCPFSSSTFQNCCNAVTDIEELTPAISLQHRILNSEKK